MGTKKAESDTNELVITIKHTIHVSVVESIMDFFEVTRKRARDMIAGELQRRGMTGDSVMVLGQNGNTLIYEVCRDMRSTREITSAFATHRVIHLATGESFVVRPPKGRGRATLEPLGGTDELEPETTDTQASEEVSS